MFTSAKSNKVSDDIVEQVRVAVFAGRLKPGDRLPSEKELMERFQVSRWTLREALRSLESLGLLEVRKGASGGAFITEIGIERARESFLDFLHFKNPSIQDVQEVLLIFEPQIAAKAASFISRDDLLRLSRLQEECAVAIRHETSEQIRAKWIEFHRIIANSCGNPILAFLLDVIRALSRSSLDTTQKPYTKKFLQTNLNAHQAIYEALTEGDAAKASRLMAEHIKEVETLLTSRRASKSPAEAASSNE